MKLKILIIMWMSFVCHTLQAQCTLPQGYAIINHNIPDLIVQRDTPVGTVLWQGDLNAGSYTAGCDSAFDSIMTVLVGSDSGMKSGVNAIFSTNVPGLGYAISYNSTSFQNNKSWPGQMHYANPGNTSINNTGSSLRLIKIDSMQSGVLSSGQYGEWTWGGPVFEKVFIANAPRITVVACTISTQNLIFPIGDVLASKFGSSIGTVPEGAQNTQSLGLNCDAGANINVMLQGTQNPDVSTTSVLALTGQGNADVAQGVGVQLLYNDMPLDLNNRIVLKQSAGGQETFPIIARYYQTKTSVSTGKANASATLDLTYQ